MALRRRGLVAARFGGLLVSGLEVLPSVAVFFNEGSLVFTAFTAVFAVFTVPDEIKVLPLAARLPMIVPAIAPATAPTGPAITLPTIAPATPPAVCLETGRFGFAGGEVLFFITMGVSNSFEQRSHGMPMLDVN